MTKVRAILFDMDGVLVQAGEWHYEALNRALTEFGYAAITHAEHCARFDGLPTRKKLQLLGTIPASQFEAINTAKQRHTLAIIGERCRPSPQHIDALSRLKQDGYRLALCSNSVRESIRRILNHSQLAPFLEFHLSYEDVGAPKPDPVIYSTAMHRFAVAPAETLILEDNPNGLASAYASGAHVMEIRTVAEVTYGAITHCIRRIEGKTA